MSAAQHTAVMIHGLIGHMRGCDVGIPVLAPDLPGYGSLREYAAEISLPAQVAYLHEYLGERGIENAHLVGHSVGGAVAMLFAAAYPQLVRSVTSVEGNFTLKDAFWSQAISQMPLPEINRDLQADIENPQAWLERSSVAPTPQRMSDALSHLENQPATTVQATARSVVQITGAPEFLQIVRAVVERGTPVFLIAGERSRDGWDVPDFVLEKARSMRVIARTGHLITIESPVEFNAACASNLRTL